MKKDRKSSKGRSAKSDPKSVVQAGERIAFPEYILGERIKFIRQARGLSQGALAKLSGVSQPTIAMIEKEKKDPSLTTLKAIAQALDLDIAALFAAQGVFVFDLKRLRRKYDHRDKLTAHLYMALGEVIQYAKDIEFLK